VALDIAFEFFERIRTIAGHVVNVALNFLRIAFNAVIESKRTCAGSATSVSLQ